MAYFCVKHSSIGIGSVFCDMMLYRLLFRVQHFKEEYCLHFLGSSGSKDGGFLNNLVPIHQSVCLICPSR